MKATEEKQPLVSPLATRGEMAWTLDPTPHLSFSSLPIPPFFTKKKHKQRYLDYELDKLFSKK